MSKSMKPELEKAFSHRNPEQLVQLVDIPYYLSQWLEPYGGIRGKRILDFGCGKGFASAGLALLYEPEMVVGVDINTEFTMAQDFFKNTTELPNLPSSLVYETVEPGAISTLGDFDVIFSWSVFEHVGNRVYEAVLENLISKLKVGGFLFVQIAPLYFSPEGSHLWRIGYKNWEHLTGQLSDVYSDLMQRADIPLEEKNALWSMFMTLNRITGDELLARFRRSGLVVLREQRDMVETTPPQVLLSAYQPTTLMNNQIVALLKKS